MKQTIRVAGKSVSNLLGLMGIFCFLLTCCASPPPMIHEPVKRYFEVDAAIDTVWKSSVQALVEKGVIISIIDRGNNLIVVEEMLEGGAFQRTTAERGYFYSGLARVSLLFTERAEQGTGIHINSVLQGFTGRYNFYVTSNGTLEKDYFLLIQNNIPAQKTYKWLDDDEGKTGEERSKEDGASLLEERGNQR